MTENVLLFYRNHKAGYSIGRVFDIVFPRLKNAHKLEVPSERDLPLSVIRNLYFIFKQRDKTSINHITGDIHYGIFALVGCKSLLTVHDLVMVDREKGLKRWIKGYLWVKWPVKLADHITCISEKTKSSLVAYTGCSPDKITVVHNAKPDDFSFVPSLYGRNILHIGTRENKNLSRVIQALCSVDCQLRIIGKLNNKQKKLLDDCKIKYTNAFGLSDEAIRQEYMNCDIVSFPSLYEGFGMPIIEGQAIGRPVVTSDIQPMNEIASHNNAMLVDPMSVESIREGFVKILDDIELRKKLISEGLANVSHFTSKHIASQYEKVYDRILFHTKDI